MARLYADENLSFPVVTRLRQLGHDVETAHESGHANKGTPDEDILAFAMSRHQTVVTFNRRHFRRLHQMMPQHEGIITCTRDDDPIALAARIDAAIRRVGILAGQLVVVVKPN
jgi:hypothetical protein